MPGTRNLKKGERFAKTALGLLESEHDKQAQSARENQQILIYIFVSAVIVLAWVLGTLQVSFLVIFFLILLTFVVWYTKVLSLTEEHIKNKEIQVHRKRALRQSESAEWLNFVINRWWVFSSNTISNVIKRQLDPILLDIKPPFLDSIELCSFSLGEQTPFIKYVHVYEHIGGGPAGKKPMSWSNVVQPPPGLGQVQQYQVVLEAEVGLNCDDFKMIFRTRMGGKWMGMDLDIIVEKLNIAGKMQFVIHLDMDTAFPHMSSVTVSFLEKPQVWFSVRVLKTFNMMEIPGLKSWIHHLVMDGLTQAMVDPGKLDIKLESTGPTNVPAKARAKANAQGLLTVTVRGEEVKGGVLVEDTRYCQLRVGTQKLHTRHMQTPGAWQDHCSFLIEDLKTQKLLIKSKTKVLLSTYTLCMFDVNLADFPFEHRSSCHHVLNEKSPKTGGSIKLELDLEYTPLQAIEDLTEKMAVPPLIPEGTVSGVMYVCMHSATNLLGLDRNGFSDPYCVLYSNGKKMKTTHYINRTKNPKWEVSYEFTVADYTKTMLSFIVYDWDGSSASEDDFLGSAHIILTKDDPRVIRNSLTLGYNLLNVGQVDNSRLGNIMVTVVFRPVASVAKSESESVVTPHTPAKKSVSNAFGESDGAKKKLSSLEKGSDCMGMGDLLTQGHGIMELHIIQAKDLVAMDLNGYSDPYCDIKINGERKFTTCVRKKTLDPVWNECVTLQLPRAGEILELIVWDKDAFFQKDFLGSLTFSLDDLKKYSMQMENDGWFPLHRIRKGQIQLKFNVVMEGHPEVDVQDMSEVAGDPFPSPSNSESADSGVPTTPHAPVNPPDTPERQVPQDPGLEQLIPPAARTPQKVSQNGRQRSRSDLLQEAEDTIAPDLQRDSKRATFPRSRAQQKRSDKMRMSSPDVIVTDPEQRSFLSDSSNHSAGSGEVQRRSPNMFSPRMSESMNDDKYYGIHGQVLCVKGLHGNTNMLYCKIRFDGRPRDLRQRKESPGKVLAKSKSTMGWTDAQLNLNFEIDAGYGVWKDSLLTFDVKSHKKSLAKKTFTLQEILGDQQEVSKWLSLNDSIELEVSLYHANFPITDSKRSTFFHGLRSVRGLGKIKE